ncbi:hypothetical protein SAY86_021863 [Trapa natans]|uniref:Uncharacterized protein n=1 Tax=Trapa natans TaxID=22666 RepID=A0AAN7RKK3_TRANT|nr:hypothetical protein SAY86_021863 [Trapa natans]
MEANHSLDLRLSPSSSNATSPSSDVFHEKLSWGYPKSVNDQQEITIFYNGRLCTFDLTELQARTILLLANRKAGRSASYKARRYESPVKEAARLHSPRCLSLMKSLQRFLEDRKMRTKTAVSPYSQQQSRGAAQSQELSLTLFSEVGRITNNNGRFVSIRPLKISSISPSFKTTMLPNETFPQRTSACWPATEYRPSWLLNILLYIAKVVANWTETKTEGRRSRRISCTPGSAPGWAYGGPGAAGGKGVPHFLLPSSESLGVPAGGQFSHSFYVSHRFVKRERLHRYQIHRIALLQRNREEVHMGTELLEIRPRELNFVVEPKKQSTCSLQLENKTQHYVAFKVKTTSPNKYRVRPNVGVVMPKSISLFTVIMQAQRSVPPDTSCKDKFLVQSTVVPAGTVDEDITPEMFSKEEGKFIAEIKLRVSLTSPPESPILSPINGALKQGIIETPTVNGHHVQKGVDSIKPDPTISAPKATKAISPPKVANDEESPGKDANLKSYDKERARLVKDIEEIKTKLSELESILDTARVTISKLKVETKMSTRDRATLKEELEMLRMRGGKKRINNGFPLLFVVMVALISVAFGYISR